jgi:hypothetical protein
MARGGGDAAFVAAALKLRYELRYICVDAALELRYYCAKASLMLR